MISAEEGDDLWAIAKERALTDVTTEYTLAPPYPVPSRWEFAGIRKVVEVLHDEQHQKLGSGDELSYNTLLFEDEAEIRNYVAGKECQLRLGNDEAPELGP